MKKILSISIGSLLAICLIVSCKESFLDLTPATELNEETYFKTEDHAKAAVSAAYDALQAESISQFFIGLANIPSNDITSQGNEEPIMNLNFFSNAPQFREVWGGMFTGINRANMAIARISVMEEIDPAIKDRLVAEAKFLRGFYYFYLANCFGGVPLYTEEINGSNMKRPRASASEIYAQCEVDFKEAASVLPSSYPDSDIGRATRGAALAYLGKVHMYQMRWADANAALEEVIDLNEYELLADFDEIFRLDNRNNAESVFEIQFRQGASGWPQDDSDAHFLEVRARANDAGGWGSFPPSDVLYQAFEDDDIRRDASIVAPGDTVYDYTGVNSGYVHKTTSTPTGYSPKKWWQRQPQPDLFGSQNLVQMRYAEVILNRAEALNELGQHDAAIAEVNKIRERAALLPLPTGMSKEEVMDAIMNERRFEFVMEFSWWFHLTRTGRAVEFLKENYNKNLQPHQLLFPIPLSEIDINPLLEQNPGY